MHGACKNRKTCRTAEAAARNGGEEAAAASIVARPTASVLCLLSLRRSKD